MFKYENLTPFQLFCCNNFPFIEETFDSLTTYKMLCKIVGYLQDKIIPTVDEIGNSQNELIEKFNELKNYVDNYFTNLDVQEEINKKLDEMAKDGTLQEIISTYINLSSVLGFDTLSDLKNASNIINGSFARTFGKNTLNDGKGSFYKIRNITNDDVVDNENIIAINNSDTLIAEKMININSDKFYVFLGDSYGTGLNELSEQTIPWTTLVPEYLGLNQNEYITNSSNGSGFKHGKTFLSQLEDVSNLIINKNKVTDIIIIGGYNDNYNSVDDNLTAMETFFDYAKTTFPNANFKLACVGWSRIYDVRQAIASRTLPAYTQCGKFNCQYLKNTEYILHDYSLFSNDNYHPNQEGQNTLSSYLTDAILNGSCNVVRSLITPSYEKANNINQLTPEYILETQINDRIDFMCKLGYLTLEEPVNVQNRTEIPILNLTNNGLILGSALDIFRQYQRCFCDKKNDSSFAKLQGSYSISYSPSNNYGVLKFINQSDNENVNNLNALNTDIIHISIPALYC